MGEIWIPEAEKLKPRGTAGTMSGLGGPRATAHCTVSRPQQFDDMHRTLIGKAAEPHLLYSFADDRLGQYFPLDRSARALMGGDAVPLSHNKAGKVNIQVEFVGSTDDWTARPDWRPGKRFRAMMRAIRSWGIEDRLVFRFAQSSADRDNVVRPRSWLTDPAHGGCWWGHCHYPKPEIHWDPGRVNMARLFAAAPTTPDVPEEDDMQLTDKVKVLKADGKTWEEIPVSKLFNRLNYAYTQSIAIPQLVAGLSSLSAQVEAFARVAAGKGVDLEAVKAAARQGSEEGVQSLLAAQVVADVDVVLAPKGGAQ